MSTSLVIKTVEGPPLPARVLNPFFDAGDWLGANATVEGTLQLRRAGSADWEATFSGRLPTSSWPGWSAGDSPAIGCRGGPGWPC